MQKELALGRIQYKRQPQPRCPNLISIDTEGNPVYVEPQPAEALDLMLEQVEAGELDIADGVLGLMRSLAGEGDGSAIELEAPGGIEFNSGWGLTEIAYRLYQESDDPELKAELERLLRVIAPPQEALARYAAPSESFEANEGQKLPGLSRQISCSEVWHEGFPESEGPSPTCLLYDSFNAGGYEFWVYYPTQMHENPNEMAHIKAAFDALKESQAKYSELVQVRSIDIVFTPIPATAIGGPAQGLAMVPAFDPGELGSRACPITVFQGGMAMEIDDFKQLIAHEMFHCIHLWRKGLSGYEDLSWYNEGMAEYFSNYVYPTINREHKFVYKFHVKSVEQSIFEMSYENTVFFQFLANTYGDPWLITFLDGMPTSGHAAMQAYLSGLPGMDLLFQDFAEAYMQGKIMDTSQEFLPGERLIAPENVVIFPTMGPLRMEAKAFQVERASLLFEPEMRYELGLELEGEKAFERARKDGAGDWVPLPESVAACEDPVGYIEVLTTTLPGSISSTAATFDISVELEEENECDQCLVGVWETAIANSDYWDAVIAGTADQETQLDTVAGLRRYVFYEDSTYKSITEGYTTIWQGPNVGGNVSHLTSTVDGIATGTYNAEGGVLLQLVEETSDFQQVTVTTVSGPLGTFSSDPQVTTPKDDSPQATDEGAPYECSDTTLSIFAELPDWNWSGYVVYERVSDDPNSIPMQP